MGNLPIAMNSSSARLILASGSAIRAQILTGAGLEFETIVKPVDEGAIKDSMRSEGAKIRDIADALAEAKAVRVSRQEAGLVIGADQIMTMDGALYDKPTSIADAKDRLWSMRGRRHELVGAVVAAENGQPVWRYVGETRLWVREFSEEFLDQYIAVEGDRPLKSVGAYRFEGPGAHLFERVEGDFFSILGLSLLPLLDYLRARGIAPQ